MKNIKLKLTLVIIAIIVYTVVYQLNTIFKEKYFNDELELSLREIKTNFKIVNHNYKSAADAVFYSISKNKKIIDILSKSLDANEKEKTILRKQLFDLMQIKYEGLKKIGLKILLFSNPHNKIFLRVHKPDKYNDDITNVRYAITQVNKNHEISRGFEAGKISHAFRNIYPLFDKNNRYLGSVDISFSSEYLQNTLAEVHGIHTHFLVNKHIIESRIWEAEQVGAPYHQSIENNDYLVSILKDVKHKLKKIPQITINKNKELIKNNMDNAMAFSLNGILEKEGLIISFLPIHSIRSSSETAAYIVSFIENTKITNIIQIFTYINLTALVIIVLSLLQIYNILSNKKELESQVTTKTKELKELNENLENKVDEEIQKNRDKELKLMQQSKLAAMGEMIGNIAHQWRQPLSVISTSATGLKLQKEYGGLTDELFDNSCDTINDNAQYLSKTIDDFRNFIKGDRKEVKFNLASEINSFLNIVKGSIQNHDIHIQINIKNDIEIVGYPDELIQCFINIYHNAKDALENTNDDKYLFISASIQDDKSIITFKDNAGGISEEVYSKIFEPYITTKHQSQGTGLGLHMTYNLIVEGMRGSIAAKNSTYEYEENKYTGAEFTITLPLKT